jgi:hypothetical protein
MINLICILSGVFRDDSWVVLWDESDSISGHQGYAAWHSFESKHILPGGDKFQGVVAWNLLKLNLLLVLVALLALEYNEAVLPKEPDKYQVIDSKYSIGREGRNIVECSEIVDANAFFDDTDVTRWAFTSWNNQLILAALCITRVPEY